MNIETNSLEFDDNENNENKVLKQRHQILEISN